MNILYLGSHSIAEYDQVKLWTDLGYNVFSIGAYSNPANPSDDKRPAIDAPYHSDLAARCHEQRIKHAAEDAHYAIDWAKADLHQDLIDWADTIIVDCFPERWIGGNWARIRDKRVVWRTIGQSNPEIEHLMRGFPGLQIVRYSPNERRAFDNAGAFAGEDALIRFGKDPQDWYGWTGEAAVVGNITQNMADRGEATGLDRWLRATDGLTVKPAGPGSEKLPGGVGALSYEQMRVYLRSIRAYFYTGTVPASYTLGLVEAMMTGVPIVAYPWSTSAQWLADLWEANTILPRGSAHKHASAGTLRVYLEHPELAAAHGAECRERAIELFGIETIGRQWLDFLGQPYPPETDLARITWQIGEPVTSA